jgi:heme-degrading monooxygenase HmoA
MIRILCRKIPKRGVDCNEFQRLINQLSEKVQSQPGFIRSESFWDSRGDITSMSDWKSKAHWEMWYTSAERTKIVDGIIKDGSYQSFIKKHPNYNIFLL